LISDICFRRISFSYLAKFFNADSNSTNGMYKFGDVESGAMMTVNFKTTPYSNNKYNFSEAFLVYDMIAEVTHESNVFTEKLVSKEDTLKTKAVYVPWHCSTSFILFLSTSSKIKLLS